jgi:drug/metabolite transporter (DMT)-like permease
MGVPRDSSFRRRPGRPEEGLYPASARGLRWRGLRQTRNQGASLTAQAASPDTAPVLARTSAVHRPPRADITVLAIAIAAVGTSGPLIAATAAPALAIAFWRNAFGAGALAPFAFFRHLGELRAMRRSQWLAALGGGIALGLHFATWTPSLTMTSVASATAFAAAQPIFAALIALVRGEHVSHRVWTGILISVVGVVALSGVDLRLSVRAFSGDLLALLAGALAAVYMTFGAKARQTLSLAPYAVICYSTASVTLALLAFGTGEHLTGLSANAWIKILALTTGAQLLGHTLFNRVLKTTSATVVSVCILLEVPTAALIAALWLGQVPSWATIPGALLILAGLVVVATSGGARGADHPGAPETADVTRQ